MTTNIKGKLVDGFGKPIANAQMRAIATQTSVPIAGATAYAKTDANGNYDFSLEIGNYSFSIWFGEMGYQYVGNIEIIQDTPDASLDQILVIPPSAQPMELTKILQALVDAEAAAQNAAEEVRNNLIPLGQQYNTFAEAQAAVADGTIKNGAYCYIRSSDNETLADEYVNNNGVLDITGKKLPSQEYIDALINLIKSTFIQNAPPGMSLAFVDNRKNYTVAIDEVGKLLAGWIKANKAELKNLTTESFVSSLIEATQLNLGSSSLETLSDGNAVSVSDSLKRICFALTKKGVMQSGKAEINKLTINSILALPLGTTIGVAALRDFAIAWRDTLNRPAVGIKKNGVFAAGKIEAKHGEVKSLKAETLEVKAIVSPEFLRYFNQSIYSRLPDIAHKIGFGQSLAAGVNTQALITIAALYTALRFIGGVRAQDGSGTSAENHAQLVPYVETYKNTANGQAWETPMGASIRGWYELMIAENYGFTPDDLIILGSVPAEGGQPIDVLSAYPGTYMQRVFDDISYGYARAQEMGKTYRPVAMYWLQGEADQTKGTTKEDYEAYFDAMQARINAHASAVCGEEVIVPIFVYQFSSWINRTPNTTYPTIPMALLDLAQTRENVYLTNPMYIHDYTDHAHLTARSSYIHGLYISVMEKRALIDGKSAKPLMPIAHKRQGRAATTWFNPIGRLAFDTSIVSNPGDYGFRILHPTTREVIPLTSVVVRYDAVTVSTASDIPEGAILQYAFHGGTTGQSPGRLSGPRGCLRDSQGDIVAFSLNGEIIRMDNYCVMFEIIL